MLSQATRARSKFSLGYILRLWHDVVNEANQITVAPMSRSVARTRAAPPMKTDPTVPAIPPGGPGEGFRQTRAAHRSETAEDYVELIADLIDAHGEARAVDIAKHLGITQATVASTVSRLQRDGLIEHRPYRSIFLTEAGRESGRDGAPAPPPGGRVPACPWPSGRNGRAGCRGDRAPCQRRDPQGVFPLY